MKLHSLGFTNNIYLESLHYFELSDFPLKIPHGHTSAPIVDKNLLTKLEWRIPIRYDDGFRRVSRLGPDVCSHWKCLNADDNLSALIRCQMGHGPGQSCGKCSGMKQCQSCSTEFTIAYLESDWPPGGRAVYVTAWKDFGPCDTPFDIRWRSQLGHIFDNLPPTKYSTPSTPGNVRRAFEDHVQTETHGLSSTYPFNSDAEFGKFVSKI